ncbi:MAG: ABC transporter ATP-binding protein, partial [Oligoflexia bacterium]|nr:ABC transporter ATP-binding protein [Oligoflexia bacterium]
MNTTETAISVNNLSKVYKLYGRNRDRLKEALHPLRKRYHRDFYALDNLSFEIKKGETVGIIGRNGSGKSTLLKILTGVLTPTSGTTKTTGRIASLLELGAGFNPQLTGLENIYFNGTVMGYSRAEMKKRISAILEFAEIGDYVNQLVKTYSSGMFVRLAFATAINVNPDILIIDEALSVGDMSFQLKCFDRFNKFKEERKTIIFVTHALDTVIKFCNRCMVMESGNIVCDDTPKEGIDVFKRIMVDQYCKTSSGHSKTCGVLRYGDKKAEITDYSLTNPEGERIENIFCGEDFLIKMHIRFNERLDAPVFAYTIKDVTGLEITGTNSICEQTGAVSAESGQYLSVEFRQNLNLRPGNYYISFGCISI